MSKGRGLICFDCNTLRNKFGMQIKHMNKVIGHVCIKCSKKREVADRPNGMGWRLAFKLFAQRIFNARMANQPTNIIRPPVGRAV